MVRLKVYLYGDGNIRSKESVKRHISLSVKGQIICRFSGLPSVKGQIEAFRNLAYTRQNPCNNCVFCHAKG